MRLACENTVTVFHIAIDDQWFLQTHTGGKAGELALLANVILHGFVVVVIGLAAHLKIEDERIDGIGIGCIAGLDGTLSSGTEGDIRSFARRIVRPEEKIAVVVGVMGVVIEVNAVFGEGKQFVLGVHASTIEFCFGGILGTGDIGYAVDPYQLIGVRIVRHQKGQMILHQSVAVCIFLERLDGRYELRKDELLRGNGGIVGMRDGDAHRVPCRYGVRESEVMPVVRDGVLHDPTFAGREAQLNQDILQRLGVRLRVIDDRMRAVDITYEPLGARLRHRFQHQYRRSLFAGIGDLTLAGDEQRKKEEYVYQSFHLRT